MKLIKMQCTNCGAGIDFDYDNRIAFCPYCGAKLLIDDESINVNINYNDEARSIEAKIKQDQFAILQQQYAEEDQQYEKEKQKWNEQYTKWKKCRLIAVISIMGLFYLFAFGNYFDTPILARIATTLFIVFFFSTIIFGSYAFFKQGIVWKNPTPAHEKVLEKRRQEMIKIIQGKSE